jgi:hypothetical protein
MDKTITFKGKKTIDDMTDKKNAKRNETKDLDDIYLEHSKQLEMINTFFLENTCQNEKMLKREIDKKINSYKSQDIQRELYNELLLISLNDVIEKLVASKLKCYYCSCNLLILYKNVRAENQWTLDRIDNDKCHSNENTLISCLKCNLQRRTRDMNKFLFTKKLKINKLT